MLKFVPYVAKGLWRHRTRTALTVSGSAVALFVFCFIGAVRAGLDRLTSGAEADRMLIVFQANRFCPATSLMPEHYGRTIAKMDGVADVLPIKVFTNNCRASLDVVVFNGVPASDLRKWRDVQLIEGSWDDFEKKDAALVGQALAKRRGLSIGQRFTVTNVTVTVAGIFASPSAPADEHLVYCHLDFLYRTRGLNAEGTVTQFEIKVADGADPHALSRTIDAHFRGGPVQTDTRTKGVFQANAVGDLVELIHLTNYLGYACVAMVLALVATTTVMAVQDRVREHAVLQTLGFTQGHVFSFVVAESLAVSVAGGVLGVAAAVGVLSWNNLAIGTEGVTVAFLPSAALVVGGLGVSAVVGLLAGLAPAVQAARAEIVASLRSV